MLWFYFLNWWKFGMLGFACSFFEFFLQIAFLCVFDVKLLQSTRLRFQRKANTIFHPKKTCSLWLACMNSLIIIMIIHIVMTVYVLRQSAFVYRVCVTSLPVSSSVSSLKQSTFLRRECQFHQGVNAQLLRLQIPKAQKIQSSQAAFFTFGICRRKSCALQCWWNWTGERKKYNKTKINKLLTGICIFKLLVFWTTRER